jgi:tetratricopeptide (TPR) repeat protein
VLGKLLIILIATIALIKGFTAAGAYTKRRKEKRDAESFMAALEACVQRATDFSSTLIAADMDKPNYLKNLAELRNALENIINDPLALEYEYGKAIEHLQKALETYTDCLSLWDVKSQRDITVSDKKAFMEKYPGLLDRTTGVGKPLPQKELRKAVRTTIWDYASRYVIQADRLFATAKSMDKQFKSDTQPELGNTNDK